MSKQKSVLPSKDLPGQTRFYFVDEPFEKKCPCLYEFLATAQVDNEVRKGGSVSLFASNGVVKVCFTDKHTQLAFYAQLDTSESLWEQLERIIQGEHEPWQALRSNPGKVPF